MAEAIKQAGGEGRGLIDSRSLCAPLGVHG